MLMLLVNVMTITSYTDQPGGQPTQTVILNDRQPMAVSVIWRLISNDLVWYNALFSHVATEPSNYAMVYSIGDDGASASRKIHSGT